ncbi:ATP-dependent zinc metalloprotease FtsH, partial [Candidatus Latescibacterota bacterium]
PKNANRVEISYSEFNTLLSENKLKSAKIHNSTLDGVLIEPMTLGREGAKRTTTNIAVNIGTYDQTFVKEMVEKDIEVTIIPEKTWMTMIISILPWILILGVWLFILKQMQGGPKGIFSFGKSKAKLMEDNQQKVTFADVAGVEEAKVELQEVIEFLKYPKKFQRLGGKIPKGALLIGPPGTGKTLLARAVAGEAGVPFFSMSGSDFVEMFVGVGASRVRDLFDQGKTNAPCILFIDEIDAVGRQRGAGIGGGHDEREQTLNQLLVEMDGFETNEGVILLAATNRPDVLDPALLRPGRFDRNIIVDWPDVKARKEILQVHAKNIKIGRNINLGNIAKGTPGMTGADLANVVNEAALLAARLNHNSVLMADFEEAKDKVMMGSARKSLIITDDEKKLTACHEAGHVLVSKFIPGADPVHKVSIIARGRALGLTHFLPTDEKHNWSYTYCVGKLTVLLGGRAAEIIKFNDMTNGASNDIENATKMARKMVCEWGMSKRIGPLTFGKKESEVFLGREIATHKDYSEETAVAIDQEVRKIVEEAQQRAETILREHVDKLEELTDELLKKEILAGYQVDKILNGTYVSEKKRPSRRRWRKPGAKKSGNLLTSDSDKNESVKEALTETASVNEKTKEIKVEKNNKKDSSDTDKNTDKSDKSDKNDKTDTKNKKNQGPKSNRSRMIRLKIGGRRKIIKKAPAQKIRKIN